MKTNPRNSSIFEHLGQVHRAVLDQAWHHGRSAGNIRQRAEIVVDPTVIRTLEGAPRAGVLATNHCAAVGAGIVERPQFAVAVAVEQQRPA
jgi:hypothetical protein